MKKFLLSLAGIVLGLSASAAFTGSTQLQLHPELRTDIKAIKGTPGPKATISSKTRADEPEEVYYTLANELNPEDPVALSFNGQKAGMQVGMAFQMEPSFVSSMVDGEIVGVTFYTGTEANENVNKIKNVTIFVTDNLNGPFPKTKTVDCPTTPFTQVYAQFDEPYTIPSQGKVYVGIYFTLTSANNASVVVDESYHINNLGGWVGVKESASSDWEWDNLTEYFGFVTLGATIRATSLPKNSVSILAIDGQPVAYQNTPFSFQFMLQNNGVNPISKLTMEFGMEGEEKMTDDIVFESPLEMNQLLVAAVPEYAAKNPTKGAPLNVRVAAIDDQPNISDNASASYNVVIVPEDKGLPRNIVIEEFTSISCVFCPLGYTSMEQIHENFPDGSIIPVCIHVNSPGRDPMTAGSYNGVYVNYCTEGVPSAIVNRTYDVYPYYDDLVNLATQLKELPGIARVDAEATLDAETRQLTINTTTKFAFDYTDGNENFILSYGITEDDLGPYTQQNGFSGYDTPVPGGWENEPETVELMYNDVARQLDKYTGIAGSIPNEIVAGEEYTYSHTMSVLKSIKDLDKIKVIVYLTNRKTGEIENAIRLKSEGNGKFSGVEELTIASDEMDDAPVEYYNLQGIRVANPSKGIYITRKGNKVSKTVIR